MEPRDRPFEDPTLAGTGSAIKDASSSGSGTPSPLTGGAVPTGGGAASGVARALNSSAILEPGTVLGGRYEIMAMLGLGGMGAVYKTYDRDIDRVIALKVIRPDLAANPDLLQRFMQELLLARQVAHKNVIRIFDVHESSGIKFITMEFIDGLDLRSLLAQRSKLPAGEALDIMQQACAGLAAAHAEGVIHRDLKPSNIMRDKNGRVVVMDFGLARMVDGGGMTQTGAMLGTMQYMSPEQAKAEPLDERSDLFTVGLILYELLTGDTPYKAESAVASLLKRTQEPAVPISDIDATVSKSLSAVVAKCLERDPKNRYQNVNELIAALGELQGRHPASIFVQPRPAVTRTSLVLTLSIALLAVALTVTAVFRFTTSRSQPAEHPPVTILVSDFQNNTSEPVFDGTLESAFSLAMEGAPFISSYNSVKARKLGLQIQPGNTRLDEKLACLVATREGISTVIGGSIAREGNSYRVTVRAVDGITDKVIASKSDRAEKQDVLVAMGKLAAGIRKALGDKTPQAVQLAAAETYTTHSLEAAHEYALAQVGQFTGKYDEAIKHSLKALEFDPELGRAYVVLAVVYNNMKQAQQAEKYFQLALSKIDSMSDREKYRTRASYYLVTRKPEKAQEELQQLVGRYPADNTGIANLALAYFYRRDMTRALEEGRRAVQIYPSNTIQRNNVGLYAMYAGDFETAIQEQRAVREMNPSLVLAYVGSALPQLALGHPEQTSGTYHEAEKVGPDGVSAASAGLADLALYQGHVSEAIKILEAGITQDLNNKNPDGAANKLAMLSQAQLLATTFQQAVRTAERALALSHELPIRFWAARVYIAAKQDGQAESISHELSRSLEADPQAYAKLIEGEIQLSHGRPQQALRFFLESQNMADTWMGRFDAGRAYVEAGTFAEAESELEKCLKRRGEATALFLDESPTYFVFPQVYYYLGRAQEGLNSPAAKDSYQTYAQLRKDAQGDSLLTDVRQRLQK